MLVAVSFTTSPSHLFPVALEIAAQAAEFTEEPVGKIKRYRATFGRTPEQAELAVPCSSTSTTSRACWCMLVGGWL
jgi:hypothetical protein